MRANNGFTLIEIIVVTFLIASVLVMAIPRFQDVTDANIKSATRSLSGTIRYLYSEAVFKKNIYRLVFDIDNNAYWVEYLDGNQFRQVIDPPIQPKRLPQNVRIVDILTERSGGKVFGGSNIFIMFLPTGYVDFGVIHLEAGEGNYYTLVTKPYTGGTAIFDEYVDIETGYTTTSFR